MGGTALSLGRMVFGVKNSRRSPQQPWKATLAEFQEALYAKRCGRERPDKIVAIESLSREQVL